MTNHFTQEEAVALAQKTDAYLPRELNPGSPIVMMADDLKALLNAAVDAKLAKAQGEDWSREQRRALYEGACAIRQLIREGCWAEQSEAIAATLDSIRTTRPQASEPAPSTAVERARTAMDVTIEDDVLSLLHDMVAPAFEDDKECTPVRLLLGDGHSGYGLYAASADYPEEGAVLLAAVKAPAALLEAQPKREPLTDAQVDAAVEAWFGAEVEAKGFKARMRLAIAAAHKIGGQG